MKTGTKPQSQKCPGCGADPECGIGGDKACWCSSEFPAALPVGSPDAACYCRSCLAKQVAELQGSAPDRIT